MTMGDRVQITLVILHIQELISKIENIGFQSLNYFNVVHWTSLFI